MAVIVMMTVRFVYFSSRSTSISLMHATIPSRVTLWLSAMRACSDGPVSPRLHILPHLRTQSHKCAVMVRITARVCAAPANNLTVGSAPHRMMLVWTNCAYTRLTNQPKISSNAPQKPATASSHTDPESERHHPRGLGLGHADAPPRTGAPGTQQHRTRGTAGLVQQRRRTRLAPPHPSRAAAQPQPQHRR